jgi:hypothetical protein
VTLDDLTLDITQHIDVKTEIGDVFRSMLYRLAKAHQRARRTDADDAGAVACQPLVSRPSQRHRPPVGSPCK